MDYLDSTADRDIVVRLLALLPDQRAPAQDRVRALVESVDRAVAADVRLYRYHGIAARALALGVAAAVQLLVGEVPGPNLPATLAAALAYARTPDDETEAEYLRCATYSYPYGNVQGCYAIDEARGCEPGNGCISGAGTLVFMGWEVGFDAVADALTAELVPWLRARLA